MICWVFDQLEVHLLHDEMEFAFLSITMLHQQVAVEGIIQC